MTQIFLVRHGEAEGNLYRRVQGQNDTFLTPKGRRQVLALAPRFADVPLAAVYAVLGRQAASEMIPVDSHWEKLGVSGFVSKPTATRVTRANQIFFDNRRYIRSKTLTAALEEAYRNQLMTGRFPSCVLNISMPLTALIK